MSNSGVSVCIDPSKSQLIASKRSHQNAVEDNASPTKRPQIDTETAPSAARQPQPQQQQQLKCNICKNLYDGKAALTAHIRTHFKVYACPVCAKSLTGDTQYQYHLQNVHPSWKDPDVPDAPDANDDANDADANAERAPTTRPAAAHQTATKRYRCDHCAERFSTHSRLNLHLHAAHGATVARLAIACDICGRICRDEAAAAVHRRSHVDDAAKDFVCGTCGRGFTRQANLEFHLRTHTGERPFRCERCPKSFAHVSGLNCHRRTHTGERPYQCPLCDKSYMHSTDMRRHRRSHGGEEKRFACEFCERRFYERKFLTVHMRSHKLVTSTIHIEMEVLASDDGLVFIKGPGQSNKTIPS